MDVNKVFQCKKCGICCEGKGGIVVSPSDLERLANFFKLKPDQVVALYGIYDGAKLKLRQNDQGNCVFFEENLGCSVHSSKPSVCKAWPFFRGNLVDPISLAQAKQFCPGIKAEISFKDFAEVGFEYLHAEKLVAHNPKTEANALIF